MTQEEKARAYDEALERMKSWVKGEHPECFTEAQKAAEFIFPELKENEDKRIKQEILELVSISGNGNQFEEIKDWLDKQGEKYSIEAKQMFIKALERVEELSAKRYKLTDCDKNSWWEDFKTYSEQILANSAKTCKNKQETKSMYNKYITIKL